MAFSFLKASNFLSHCLIIYFTTVQFNASSLAFVVKRQSEYNDIETNTIPQTEQADLSHRWPGGIVPYEVAEDVAPQVSAIISTAIDEFKQKTCIQFIPHTDEDNFIRFVNSDRCMSTIGRVGGLQQVELGPMCADKGAALHEMLHALGFGHEHQRPDRDEYIEIMWDNVKEDNVANFEKDEFQWGLDVQYDYTSVMHYSKDAFSKQPGVLHTIVPKGDQDQGVEMGQRNGLSSADVQKVEKHYMCVNKKSLAPDVHPSCHYNDQRYEDGEEFNEGSYVMRCTAYLNGAKLVEPVACLDGGGERKEKGEQWTSGSFIVQCQLDYNEDGTSSSGGPLGIIPVGCMKPNGEQAEIGESWVSPSGSGPFSFVIECSLAEDGSINAAASKCHYAGPEGTTSVSPGCFHRLGKVFVSCTKNPATGGIGNALASSQHPDSSVQECAKTLQA